MTAAIHRLVTFLIRLIVLWIVDAIALLLTAAILPGMSFGDTEGIPAWMWAVAAAFLIGVINLLIRPILLIIAKALNPVVLFLVGFLVNGIFLIIAANLLPGFQINGLFEAIIAGIIFSAINVILTNILELNEEGSYYQNKIEKLAAKQQFKSVDEPGAGLVMIEIDGLSYHHLHKAISEGRMPTLQKMVDVEGYKLSKVDCGIPSQTSACQAGILFGDNFDIPAFRWYDKDKQKLYVSGSDAAELNSRYARGNGLLRQGSSIDNMLNGDAEKSLLTLADIKTGDKDQKKRRAEDIYLLLLNPYFLMRTLALFFGCVIRELWEGWQQQRKDVYPRLNRRAHFYPFVRAATSVVVRDLAANLTILDIIRGSPAIYITWPGYDEVAHHSGPWTTDALNELARYDDVIARVRKTIREKAPRPYDLIILSDHGQSFGPTFKMRYGQTLKEIIESKLPQGTSVSQSMGGDTSVGSLNAVSVELQNVQDQKVGSGMGNAVARQSKNLVDKGVKDHAGDVLEAPAQVTAYGSGNLAQVYFDLFPRKIRIDELNEAYPGMVDNLVEHEGIGLVCGYNDQGTPIAIGKRGMRNLHSGEVTGEDPLKQYAPEEGYGAASLEKRIWQVRRVMDFPHSGDLMVISSVYPDGSVAALEELIGNHGGLGGEQTDAFIFHPPQLQVPDTRNSIDVFNILNNHRGSDIVVRIPEPTIKESEAWSPSNLLSGLGKVRHWSGFALRTLVYDREAYREVSSDVTMTGPALLIAMVMLAITAFSRPSSQGFLGMLIYWLVWFIAVFVIFLAGRILTRKGSYSRTLRAIGFAQSVNILQILAFLQPIASMVNVLTFLLGFLATWIGAAEAHETRGWRTLLFPIIAFLVLVGGWAVIMILLESMSITFQALLQGFGIQLQ